MLSFRCYSRSKQLAFRNFSSEERYNYVNKRILRFIFANYLSSYHLSRTLHLCAISAFKISSCYCLKVHCCCCFFLKGLSSFYERYVFSPVLFLCMIFVEITFCPSINLEQPVMVLVLFLTYQLSCGMGYLILSVPLSLLVLKENQGPHFVQRLFFLINISLNIMYLVMYLCMLCILAVNVMPGRY